MTIATEVQAEPVMALAAVNLKLTPDQANALYNELYSILRDFGVSTVGERDRLTVPTLYALYDSLHRVGVDGTLPPTSGSAA